MHRTRATALALCLLLVGAACGGDDEPAATTTTTEATTSEPAEDGAADTTSTVAEEAEDDGCTNDLEVVGATSAVGPIEPVTTWADAGPHPDNTVDFDRTLELAIATFEIPVDEQFGRGVPVGVPEIPAGGVILTAYLSRSADQDPIAAGQRYTGVDDSARAPDDGTINSLMAWAGEESLLLGDSTITITAISDDTVCGTIEGVERTDLQELTAIEGTFVLDRIQALDAADEADGG